MWKYLFIGLGFMALGLFFHKTQYLCYVFGGIGFVFLGISSYLQDKKDPPTEEGRRLFLRAYSAWWMLIIFGGWIFLYTLYHMLVEGVL